MMISLVIAPGLGWVQGKIEAVTTAMLGSVNLNYGVSPPMGHSGPWPCRRADSRKHSFSVKLHLFSGENTVMIPITSFSG